MTEKTRRMWTNARKVWRGGWAVALLLLLVSTALALGLVAVVSASHADNHANTAGLRAARTSACINKLLGDRSDITARDNAAHVAFAGMVSSAIAKIPLTNYLAKQAKLGLHLTLPSNRPLTEAELVKGINAYTVALTEDQQIRDAKPLGKC